MGNFSYNCNAVLFDVFGALTDASDAEEDDDGVCAQLVSSDGRISAADSWKVCFMSYVLVNIFIRLSHLAERALLKMLRAIKIYLSLEYRDPSPCLRILLQPF